MYSLSHIIAIVYLVIKGTSGSLWCWLRSVWLDTVWIPPEMYLVAADEQETSGWLTNNELSIGKLTDHDSRQTQRTWQRPRMWCVARCSPSIWGRRQAMPKLIWFCGFGVVAEIWDEQNAETNAHNWRAPIGRRSDNGCECAEWPWKVKSIYCAGGRL